MIKSISLWLYDWEHKAIYQFPCSVHELHRLILLSSTWTSNHRRLTLHDKWQMLSWSHVCIYQYTIDLHSQAFSSSFSNREGSMWSHCRIHIVHANRMPNQQWWLVSSTGWCNNAITHFRPRTSDSGTMRGKVTVIKKERDRITLTHSTDLMLSMVVLSIMYICWRQKSKCTHSFTETYYVCASPAKWESGFPVLRKGGDQLQTELQTRGDGVFIHSIQHIGQTIGSRYTHE